MNNIYHRRRTSFLTPLGWVTLVLLGLFVLAPLTKKVLFAIYNEVVK